MTAYIRFFLMDILFRLGLGMRCLHGHRNYLDSRYCDRCGIPMYALTPWARIGMWVKVRWEKALAHLTDSRFVRWVEQGFDKIFFPDDARNQPLPTLWWYHRVVVVMMVLLGTGLVGLITYLAILLA
jgi:hypothetical protein